MGLLGVNANAFVPTQDTLFNGYGSPPSALSIPELRNPSPAVAKAPAPLMPSYLGSGYSNVGKNYNLNAFKNITSTQLTPTLNTALNRETGRPGATLNILV